MEDESESSRKSERTGKEENPSNNIALRKNLQIIGRRATCAYTLYTEIKVLSTEEGGRKHYILVYFLPIIYRTLAIFPNCAKAFSAALLLIL